jgi:hypothetical protein
MKVRLAEWEPKTVTQSIILCCLIYGRLIRSHLAMRKPNWIIRPIVAAVFAAVGLAACGGTPQATDIAVSSSTNGLTAGRFVGELSAQ